MYTKEEDIKLRKFCIAFFILGVIFQLSAFHNIDTAWNMNIGDYERSIFGHVNNRNGVYDVGCRMLIVSLMFFVIGFSIIF